MKRFIHNLGRDERGATLVEFAILIPVILGTFLGVMQVGLGMQAYNSLRNITADTSRYTTVEYQKENMISTTAIETQARTIATSAPYLLTGSRFTVAVKRATTQRVDGAIELEIKADYTTQSVLGFMGIGSSNISFTRPIFVLDSSV